MMYTPKRGLSMKARPPTTWGAVSNRVGILPGIQATKDAINSSTGAPSSEFIASIEARILRLLALTKQP